MIEKFLNEEQDPKTVEKIYIRLADLLSTGEEILYIAVQKNRSLIYFLTALR